MKSDVEIPYITNVTFLRAHDLIIEFDNGEERIVDMTESFEVPAALKYAPPSQFKKFGFNKNSVWWGDEDWIVGRDSLYNTSFPISHFTSSLFMSMGIVDHRTEPFEGWIKVRGNEATTGHKEPHAHVDYKDEEYLFALSGGLLKPAPDLTKSTIDELDAWVTKNRRIAVEEWNKWNPALLADPETGRRI